MFDTTKTQPVHYHLEVQAIPKKMAQKNDDIFSIYGRNGIAPQHLFSKFSLGPFKVIEVE